MNKCLAAFTDSSINAPPFINASLTPMGHIEIMIRSEAKQREGVTFPVADMASMVMDRERFIAFCTEALDTLSKL